MRPSGVGQALATVWILATAIHFSPVDATQRPVQLQDLDIGYPGSGIALSRDENLLAVEDNSHLVILEYASGRMVQDLGHGLLPQRSPGQDKLAFYSTRSGVNQLWTWERGKLPRQLTNLPKGVDPDFFSRYDGYVMDAFRYSWSPDGRRIAFASRIPVASQSAHASDPLVLTNSTDPNLTTADVCALPTWCGVGFRVHGRTLVEEPFRRADAAINQLFVVDTRSGELTQITQPPRIYYDPIWAGDGSAVIAASILPPEGEINVWTAFSSPAGKPDVRIVAIDPKSAATRDLFNDVGAARELRLSAGGDLLHFFTSDTYVGQRRTQVANLEQGRITRSDAAQEDAAPERIAALNVSMPAWLRDARGALTFVDIRGNVWRLDKRARKPVDLFRFRPAELRFAREDTLVWKNTRGVELKGSLLYPLDYQAGQRYPLIVDAYPLAQAHGWMDSMGGNQTWAAAGYMVFMPGERTPHTWMNSTSQNRAFAEAGKGPRGFEVALDDVISGIDELARRGLINAERMCLYGHSNGGGAVSYLVTMTDRFKCAVVAAPAMADWITYAVVATNGRTAMEQGSGGMDFERDFADFVKMSAVFNLHKSRTPTLIVSGDNDTSLRDAIGVYNAVRDTGIPVTLVRYPGQGHVLTGAAMEDFWKRQMAFFSKYIAP